METNGTNGHAHAATPSTALVKQQSQSLSTFEPKTLDEAWRLAGIFAKSGLLGEVHTPEQVMVIMATGFELGIPPTTALRGIYVIKGRPVVSADLLVALCLRRSDVCERFALVSSSDSEATYETKRRGCEPVRMSFSMADAQRAKLPGKEDSNWSKYPATMLRHRAAAQLARAVYPDLVLGLYVPEEADEIRDVTPTTQPIIAGPVEPIVERAPEEAQETAAEALDRWSARFASATSIAELDAVAAEFKASGAPTEIRDAIRTVYSTRQKALKAQVGI